MTTNRRGALSRIWTVARRELNTVIDQPMGYVLLIVFVGINAFLYFRQTYLMGVATLRPMLDLLPWVFLFFVPAVSMRTVAEDTRGGNLEVVLTQPIDELELLLGKFFGAVLFLWLALALTLPIPLLLTIGAKMKWGPIVAQYIGCGLLAAGLTGVGVWASSLTRSQITAFILAVAVMFVLVLVGLDPLLVGLPPTAAAIAARLGVLSHFEAMGRGVIDLRDVIYFLSLAGVFLALAYGSLVSRRLSPAGAARKRLRTGVALTTVVVLVVNLLGGYIGGRLDLSPGKAYTLSKATKDLVRNLDDIVTIKLFESDELPTGVALMRRELDDLLRDLRSAARGKVRVVRRNTTSDETAQKDAEGLGVQRVQFNVVGTSELSVKEGFLGLSIQYGAKNEAIPFVNRTDDLEYRLATTIRGLTRARNPVVGIISGGPALGPISVLQGALGKTYEVRDIQLTDSTQPANDVVALMLVGNPDSVPAAMLARISAAAERGTGILVFGGGMEQSQQAPFSMPHPSAWNAVLQPFGVQIKSNMVFDLAANEVVPARANGPFQVLQRYPFFVRAHSTAKSTVNKDLTNALIPWPSAIDTTHSASWTFTPLFTTTDKAGESTGPTPIDPSRDWPRTNLSSFLLGVQVTPTDTTKHGRAIVVGNGDMIANNFGQHAPENFAFALNAIDWLAQDASFIAIRARDARPPAIEFTSNFVRDGVKYLNVAGVPLLVAVLGALRLMRRRRRSREPFRPSRLPAAEGAGA